MANVSETVHVSVEIVNDSTEIVHKQIEETKVTESKDSQQTPCYPLPFGYVPYGLALPGAMGPLLDFPIEWWYYAGWATDVTGKIQFTILTLTMRSSSFGGIMYGIGIVDHGQHWFTTNFGMGMGEFPAPTSTSWSTTVSTTNEQAMACRLVSGITGLSGATYQMEMTDPKRGIAVSLQLKDEFGMVMEGASGAFRGEKEASFEFSMPKLSIMKGTSSITISGDKYDLGSGNLWLDRQTIGSPDSFQDLTPDMKPEVALANFKTAKSLYIGNWLAVYMNDGNHYSLTFFWPKKSDQWIVGDKLKPPVPPTSKRGLEYPSQKSWNKSSPVQGVHVLDSNQFNLNILQPKNVKQSPHWTSSKSGQTYCTAWQLKLLDQDYTMTALIQSSEVFLGTYFFEGAAMIRNKKDQVVGQAFVEQMGYN